MKHFKVNYKRDQHIQNTISTIKKISQDSINIHELLSEIKPNDNTLLSAQESIQENFRILTFYSSKCVQLLEKAREDIYDLNSILEINQAANEKLS